MSEKISPTSFARQRINMIERQVRPWNVLDEEVLRVMTEIPREQFTPERLRPLAYSDTRIPLACHQEMIAPGVVGRLLQALTIEPRHRILEIGTGSGYVTACLSRLGKQVTSVEYHEPIYNQAHINLRDYQNIELIHGDGLSVDLPTSDLVLINASVASIPARFINAIKPEGRMVAVVGSGDEPMMRACLIEMNAGHPLRRELFDTWLTPIIS